VFLSDLSSDVNKTFLSRPRPRPQYFSRPRPRPRPRLFGQDQGETFYFETKTKTKTLLGPLHRLRYIIITKWTQQYAHDTDSCVLHKDSRSNFKTTQEEQRWTTLKRNLILHISLSLSLPVGLCQHEITQKLVRHPCSMRPDEQTTMAKIRSTGADVQSVQSRKHSQITTANKQTARCPSLDATECQPQCRQVSAARTRDTSWQCLSVARLLSLLIAEACSMRQRVRFSSP